MFVTYCSLTICILNYFLLWQSKETLIVFTFLQILRIGFYEIVKLNMPTYAVVDEVIFYSGATITL